MVDKLLTKPCQAEGVVASTVVNLCKRGNGLLVSVRFSGLSLRLCGITDYLCGLFLRA